MKKIFKIMYWGKVGHSLASLMGKLIHLSSRGNVKVIFYRNSKLCFLDLHVSKFDCCQFVTVDRRCLMYCVFHNFMFLLKS